MQHAWPDPEFQGRCGSGLVAVTAHAEPGHYVFSCGWHENKKRGGFQARLMDGDVSALLFFSSGCAAGSFCDLEDV